MSSLASLSACFLSLFVSQFLVHSISPAEEVSRLCQAICAQDSSLVYVFVLHVIPHQKQSFNFLWGLPKSQVYLSKELFLLGGNDREIAIVWENSTYAWRGTKLCGYRDCRITEKNIEQLNLEKRVLIRIQKLREAAAVKPNKLSFNALDLLVTNKQFWYYRTLFVVFRKHHAEIPNSSWIVTGENIDSVFIPLKVKEFGIAEAKIVLEPMKRGSNLGELKSIDVNRMTLGNYSIKIRFESCSPVSTRCGDA